MPAQRRKKSVHQRHESTQHSPKIPAPSDKNFEVIRHGDRLALAFWDGQKIKVGTEILRGEESFSPSVAWNTEFLSIIQLAWEPCDYGSGHQLIEELRQFFATHPGLTEDAIVMLVAFAFSSWFPEYCQVLPCLSVLSTNNQSSDLLLRMLHCVCRHSIRLTEITESGIFALPLELALTLLINQRNPSPNLQRIFRAMSQPGQSVFRSGECRDIACPLAIFSAEPIDSVVDVVEITLMPGPVPSANLEELWHSAYEFQGKLLRYKLENLQAVRGATFDIPAMSSPETQLAEVLGRPIIGHDRFRQEVWKLLSSRSEESGARDSMSIPAIVIESALAACHEQGRQSVRVGELSAIANTILKARGETIQIEPRALGTVLRRLGLSTQRLDAAGRGIALSKDVRKNIHRLSGVYQVLSVQERSKRCEYCRPTG